MDIKPDKICKLDTCPSDSLQATLWTCYKNIKHLYQTGQIERSMATTMRLKAYTDYE